MISRIAIFLFCLFAALQSIGQEYPRREVNLEILADELFGFQDIDLNYQDLYENIALILANPIDLNTATAENLRFLNLLSELEIQNILKYRQEIGPFLSLYELQAVQGFDLPLINRIIPFVTVASKTSQGSFFRRVIEEENNYLLIRYDRTLESRAGFDPSTSEQTKYHGSEDELYMRFRTSKPGDFSFGFTMEKDAGEEISWSNQARQYGFDYYSFHAQIQNKGKLKNLIVGDYQTQFGQGLLLGGSFGYGKGSETIMTVRRSNLGILPYTSVNETGYKRGIGITYELSSSFSFSSFYSLVWRDATLVSDESEEVFVSSFQTTGLHRNEGELSNRHKIREQNYGVILNYRKNRLDAGIIFTAIDFNIPISPNPQPYNQFTFAGSNATNVGAFFNYTLHNFTLFSEVGKSVNEGYGFTAGILGSITSKFDIALHIRNYQRNFHSLYSNAFSETSLPQNESGFYWGWKYQATRKISASGYADLFRFPWLRFRAYSPSEGYEWLLRLNYQPNKNILIFLQARQESKVRNLPTEQSNSFEVGEGVKTNYWINCDYSATQKLKLKTRLQFSSFETNHNTKGLALIQDISYSFGRLTVAGRYALFDTDDFDNRQYLYERDVWLAYSLPAYSGVGVRSYILVEYAINKRFSIWVRFARTRYSDRDEIGSGADLIKSDTRNDIRIQSRIKF